MLAHGYSIDMMVGLVNAGLATATAERMVAGGKTIEVARVRITDAGLKALIQWHHQARSAPRARGRAFGR
jgi:hypothetical protein